MQGLDGVLKNAGSAVAIYQKSSFEWNNMAKFIDDKGYRPGIKIAQKASDAAERFYSRMISYTTFELSMKLAMLRQILQVLKDILAEMRKQGKMAVSVMVNVFCNCNSKAGRGELNRMAYNDNRRYYYNNVNIRQTAEDKGFDLAGFLGETISAAFIQAPINEFMGRFFKKHFPEGGGNSKGTGGEIGKSAGNADGVFKKAFSAGQDIFKKVGSKAEDVFSKIAKAISVANIKLLAFRAATVISTVAQWAYNAAISASPVTWIIMGIIALIASIILLVKNWDKVKNAVASFWKATVKIFGNVAAWFQENVVGPINGMWTSIGAAVTGLWNKIVSIFGNIGAWFKNNVINPILGMVPDWLKKFFGIDKSNSNLNVNVNSKPNGSKACGFSYVPFDGYIAELHKGERVLTASENRVYSNPTRTYSKSSPASGGNTFNITINGMNKTTDQIMNELVKKVKNAANTMGEAVVA